MKPIGEVIRQERQAAGLSQDALAKLIDTHVNSIQNYESGRRQPSKETITQLETVFGVPLRQLRHLPDSIDKAAWIEEFDSLYEEQLELFLQQLTATDPEARRESERSLRETARAIASILQLDRHGLMRRASPMQGGFGPPSSAEGARDDEE